MSGDHDHDRPTSDDAGGADPPRILIIGAGSRGHVYGNAVCNSSIGTVVAVAEPSEARRLQFGRKYIWGEDGRPADGQSFTDWREFVQWEQDRRGKAARGEPVPRGADGVFVCTLDETHAEIVTALAPLSLHVLCEKPLATTLDDCLDIYQALRPDKSVDRPSAVFAVGHVLRYSPHNILLRKLLLEENVIGDIVSVEHTEPVGWWHFAHSYVRGNWRKESRTAPSLLTKSCHDIDLLLWLLSSPPPGSRAPSHLPSTVSSTGSLVFYHRRNKPHLAGTATNCTSCPAESTCLYSAKKLYLGQLRSGNTGWPVKVVVPEIEECIRDGSLQTAEDVLMARLADDYDDTTPDEVRDSRPWFGRCVYEADNDVCDDQFVTITWEDEGVGEHERPRDRVAVSSRPRGAKRATFHMVAFTERICERRSRIYGTKGELEADSRTIRVHDFASGTSHTYHPKAGSGHGGGDEGLARQFLRAIHAVKHQGMSVADAQRVHIGCTLDDIIQSHAMVFAAEKARRHNRTISWSQWWNSEVEARLRM